MKRCFFYLAVVFFLMTAGTGVIWSASSEKSDSLPAVKKVKVDGSKASATNQEPRKLVVTYFHGNARCFTCKKFEALTKDIMETRFADEIKEGRLEYRVVNIDEPENKHYIKDYGLFTKSVVLSDVTGGKQTRWKNLEKIWEMIRDEDAYRQYIEGEVRSYVEKAG